MKTPNGALDFFQQFFNNRFTKATNEDNDDGKHNYFPGKQGYQNNGRRPQPNFYGGEIKKAFNGESGGAFGTGYKNNNFDRPDEPTNNYPQFGLGFQGVQNPFANDEDKQTIGKPEGGYGQRFDGKQGGYKNKFGNGPALPQKTYGGRNDESDDQWIHPKQDKPDLDQQDVDDEDQHHDQIDDQTDDQTEDHINQHEDFADANDNVKHVLINGPQLSETKTGIFPKFSLYHA
jgi:hypothetical protein